MRTIRVLLAPASPAIELIRRLSSQNIVTFQTTRRSFARISLREQQQGFIRNYCVFTITHQSNLTAKS